MVNIYQVSDTRWSNALTTYNAIWMDVNNGAGGAAVGAAASRLLKLTNNTTEVFGVDLNGAFFTAGNAHINNQTITLGENGSGQIIVRSAGAFGFTATANALTTPDTILYRDAANIWANRNAANAQNFRFYNTYTDTSNGAWAFINAAQTGGTESGAANTLTFGTIGNGTGAAVLTKFKLVVDGTSRLDYGVTASSVWTFGASVIAPASGFIQFSGRTYFESAADGLLVFRNNAGSGFSRLQFGGTTTAFPALKRSGAGLSHVLADGTLPTTFTPITTGVLQVSGTSTTDFGGLRFTAATFASLPTAASAGAGAVFYITDGSTGTFGATCTGGSTNAVMIYSDATQYKVF